MSLWVCRQCTAAFAVGLPACPQCGGTEYTEDWNMPKITGEGLSVEQPPQAPAEPAPALPAAGTAPEPVGVPAPAAEPDPAPEPPPAPAHPGT
jgi:hypothetical protein